MTGQKSKKAGMKKKKAMKAKFARMTTEKREHREQKRKLRLYGRKVKREVVKDLDRDRSAQRLYTLDPKVSMTFPERSNQNHRPDLTLPKSRITALAEGLNVSMKKVQNQLPHLHPKRHLHFCTRLPYHSADLAPVLDSTAFGNDVTRDGVVSLAAEAEDEGFSAITLLSSWVPLARASTSASVCAVVGFPLGQSSVATKVFEAQQAVSAGATEVEMVLNTSWLLLERFWHCYVEVRALVSAMTVPVTIVVDCKGLSEEQLVDAALVSVLGGAQGVKACTGWAGSRFATVRDVELIRAAIGFRYAVKAAVDAKTAGDAHPFLRAGATRLCTADGVDILSSPLPESAKSPEGPRETDKWKLPPQSKPAPPAQEETQAETPKEK